MTRRGSRAEAGFGLVETLVAVLVVAAMMGMTFATVAANSRAETMTRDRRAAMLVAQSVLAQATGPAADTLALDRGRVGTFEWAASVGPFGGGAREGGPPLERIEVQVGRDGRRLVSLATLRLAR